MVGDDEELYCRFLEVEGRPLALALLLDSCCCFGHGVFFLVCGPRTSLKQEISLVSVEAFPIPVPFLPVQTVSEAFCRYWGAFPVPAGNILQMNGSRRKL